jgi:hypothetical protein
MRVRAVRGRFRSADQDLHVDESLQGVEAESEIIVRIGVMHAVVGLGPLGGEQSERNAGDGYKAVGRGRCRHLRPLKREYSGCGRPLSTFGGVHVTATAVGRSERRRTARAGGPRAGVYTAG